jgi:hypothetical protein
MTPESRLLECAKISARYALIIGVSTFLIGAFRYILDLLFNGAKLLTLAPALKISAAIGLTAFISFFLYLLIKLQRQVPHSRPSPPPTPPQSPPQNPSQP